MQIETGLFPHMVVQRNRRNVSQADYSGACAMSDPILATVRRGKGVVKGFASAPMGKASRGRMKGCLKGLPAGGPYTIELRAGNEKLTIKDVLTGDVWLLGGQSNMQGCGLFPKKRLPADPQVRAFFMDDRWPGALCDAKGAGTGLSNGANRKHPSDEARHLCLRPFRNSAPFPGDLPLQG